jgi:hypothetical protein
MRSFNSRTDFLMTLLAAAALTDRALNERRVAHRLA